MHLLGGGLPRGRRMPTPWRWVLGLWLTAGECAEPSCSIVAGSGRCVSLVQMQSHRLRILPAADEEEGIGRGVEEGEAASDRGSHKAEQRSGGRGDELLQAQSVHVSITGARVAGQTPNPGTRQEPEANEILKSDRGPSVNALLENAGHVLEDAGHVLENAGHVLEAKNKQSLEPALDDSSRALGLLQTPGGAEDLRQFSPEPTSKAGLLWNSLATSTQASHGIRRLAVLVGAIFAASLAIAYILKDAEVQEPQSKNVAVSQSSLAPTAPVAVTDSQVSLASSGGVNTQFCPELVVPQICECALVIPVGSATSFSITDARGVVVLRVTTSRSSAAPSSSALSSAFALSAAQAVGTMTLTTPDGSALGLICPAGSTLGEAPSLSSAFHLLRSGGEFFAQLTMIEDARYQLATLGGKRMNFLGSFTDHSVTVTEEGRGLVATTELCSVDFDPSGEYYKLLVAPATDVGLVLLSILAVDRLAGTGRGCTSARAPPVASA